MILVPVSGPLVFAAALLVTVFLLIFGRALISFVFRPVRKLLVFVGRRVLAPLYRWTLRPFVRLARRSLRTATNVSGVTNGRAPAALGGIPYKALVNILEMSSLAQMALGEVPRAIKDLVDRKGLFFRSVNANRAVAGVQDTLSIDGARANMDIARKYYERSLDDDRVSPTFLYEDAEEALIIDILRDADIAFFWVLRRLKRNVSRNVVKIMATMTGLVAAFPFVMETVVVDTRLESEKSPFNMLVYTVTFAGFGVTLWLLRNAYANSARYNGQNFNHFVQTYFSRLLNQYKSAAAAFSHVLNDRTARLDAVEIDSGIWFVNLHWTSARQWFLELFVRNIMFQIRRDWLWFMISIPVGMVLFWAALYFSLHLIVVFLNAQLGFQLSLTMSGLKWSWWTIAPFLALLAGYFLALGGLLNRFWYEIATHTWASFRAMDIKDAIERTVGPIVREVVDKRRNPYGQQQQPPIGPT